MQGISDEQVRMRARELFLNSRQFINKSAFVIGPEVFILQSSPRNTISIPEKDGWSEWVGLPWDQKQVVIVFGKRVYPEGKLPADYKLEDSLVVSFEGDTIRYFNFKTFSGCRLDRSIDLQGLKTGHVRTLQLQGGLS